jgi:hypothetical protein
MVIAIKKGDSKKTIARKLKSIPEKKGFQALKYLGTVNVEEDALAIQKELRDGWKERLR